MPKQVDTSEALPVVFSMVLEEQAEPFFVPSEEYS